MTQIQCECTECRYNGQGLCLADQILVTPGSVAAVPDVLDTTGIRDDWRPGYASEFDAYAAYAGSHPESLGSGALCKSYTP